MTPSPRLRSEIRVSAHLRRCAAAGVFAAIVKKGDADAGAIAVKIYLQSNRAILFVESYAEDGAHEWRNVFDGETDEAAIDAYLQKEIQFDPDLWIVEIEDVQGRSFLHD